MLERLVGRLVLVALISLFFFAGSGRTSPMVQKCRGLQIVECVNEIWFLLEQLPYYDFGYVLLTAIYIVYCIF